MESQEASDIPASSRALCKNCGKKLSKHGSFCPACGQRDFDGRVRMRELLAKFFANFTHLDNKFVRMCWQLLIPAKVTLNYFQGKIKRYPHPVQFFFIVMFFFLLLFNKQFDNITLNSTGGDFSLHIGSSDTLEEVEMERQIREFGTFSMLQHYVAIKNYRSAYNALPDSMRNPKAEQALDAVLRQVDGPWERAARKFLAGNGGTDSITFDIMFSRVRISVFDLVNLEPDSIIKKYGYNSWQQQLTVRQGIKTIREPRSLINRFTASLGWAILILIALMALVLRLLYRRKKRMYVEHFIFLMHLQSGAYLLFTLALLLHEYVFSLQWVWLLVFLWILLFQFLAMKWYYPEKWTWTLLKWAVFCSVYIFGLTGLFIATLLIDFIVF